MSIKKIRPFTRLVDLIYRFNRLVSCVESNVLRSEGVTIYLMSHAVRTTVDIVDKDQEMSPACLLLSSRGTICEIRLMHLKTMHTSNIYVSVIILISTGKIGD